MKFYSEITKEMYDTPEALQLAEKAVIEAQRKREEMAKATAAIKAKREDELRQTIVRYCEIEDELNELIEEYEQAYGEQAADKFVSSAFNEYYGNEEDEDEDKELNQPKPEEKENKAKKPAKKEIVKEFHCKSPEDVAEMFADIFGTLYEAMGCDEDDEDDEDEDKRPPLPHPFSLFF